MAEKQDEIENEIYMDSLGTFTAYKNKAIKAQFDDRTIIRMMKGCKLIRILTNRGDELSLDITQQQNPFMN